MSPSIVNKPINCQFFFFKGKQKRYFVGSFLNHMDPCAYLLKWSRYAPALYFLKSLPTFKALTVMADIM